MISVYRELNELAMTWHATLKLIDQCRALLNRTNLTRETTSDDGKFALLLAGTERELEFVIETAETPSGEFELVDAICQSAMWFTSIDASVPNLKRMRSFDLLLKRHGLEAAFIGFTEEEGMRIGNELARFMFTQFGRDNTAALINGSKILSEMGIERELAFFSCFEAQAGKSLIRSGNKMLSLSARTTND